MKKDKRMKLLITSAFAALQIAVMIVLAYRGEGDYLRSVMITTCAWLGYTVADLKYRMRLGTYIQILMVLTIFFDSFFGYYFNLYETSGSFDKAQHVFGTYSFSLFVYFLVMKLQKEKLARSVRFILVLCLGLSLGSLYEIMEFIGDHVSHPLPPNQPSLLDTDFDLIGDLLGALLAAIHTACHDFAGKRR